MFDPTGRIVNCQKLEKNPKAESLVFKCLNSGLFAISSFSYVNVNLTTIYLTNGFLVNVIDWDDPIFNKNQLNCIWILPVPNIQRLHNQ